MNRLLVWDLPTRLFHWLFAITFVAAYVLGESEGWLGWHSYFGYLAGGLVLFRVVWGFVGGQYSRFRDFPLNPLAAMAYLKGLLNGDGPRYLGHNPAGALAIYGLLFLGLASAVSGVALLGADEGMGPLAGYISERWEEPLEEFHEVLANAMLALVLLHIAGVIVGSLRHKENLPRSMVTGYKEDLTGRGQAVKSHALMAATLLAVITVFTVLHDFSAGCGGDSAVCQEEEGGEDEDDD